MALRNIRTDEDPVLRTICKPVKEINEKTKALIEDMFETMYAENGVGLAAPQVGIVRRIVVIDDTEGNKLALINPVLTPIGNEIKEGVEGCLSLPGYSGIVDRAAKVHVDALDENGKEVSLDAEGMLAVILQHETDHLDGILYKDQAKDYYKNETADTEED